MFRRKRTYGLGIWALGLGYYLFYTPYSGLTKALSNGVFPSVGRVPGVVLLPASAVATVVGMLGFITIVRWWKYAGHRDVFGIKIPFPRPLTFLSGVCMATIIATTTLAFSFQGVSIVLVLVLLRGGVLIIAPLVDAISKRRVRWFSLAAMLISLMAVTIVLSDAANYRLSTAAIIDIAAYMTAYFFKFQFMSRLAKSNDRSATLRYFVEEQMVASPLLLLGIGGLAIVGVSDGMTSLRTGFNPSNKATFLAVLIGLFYAGLCVCTTLIFLDRRENTFCVPMHCGSSMLSGITASVILGVFFNQPAPSNSQLMSAGLIIIALGFLSPLHHLDRYFSKLRSSLGRWSPDNGEVTRQFLFVCSGNTCRSPMAVAIGNAEIAERLNIPLASVGASRFRALSAGLSAKVGAPITPEAKQTLHLLGIAANGHRARNINADLTNQAERIFCMTRSHRDAVIELVPMASEKTLCLDPNGDIDDPAGAEPAVYVDCARRLQRLVKLRFDEAGLAIRTQHSLT